MPKPPISPAQVQGLLAAMGNGLLEREATVRLALLAALGQEHVLLIGPPGSAKSELARRLHLAFESAPYFERLLTRFSTPEELFGPLSLKALEEDRYERLIEGYLACAGMAFLDEVFKANSAILNALLTLLNEREYDHGAGRIRTPLISVVGATNEVPADEALQAFLDRFLLRIPVRPVSDASFQALLELGRQAPQQAERITPAQRHALLQAREQVALAPELLNGLARLRQWLAQREVPVSDRRWRQLAQLLRLQAASEGLAEAAPLHLWLAPYALAAEPAQTEDIAQWVAQELLQVRLPDVTWLQRAADALERQLETEATAPAQEGDDAAGKMALARSLGGAAADDGPARVRSATLEERLRKRYSPVHVAARVSQVSEALQRAEPGLAELRHQRDALAAAVHGRLWLPPGLACAWLATLDEGLNLVQALCTRLSQVREGFASLPQDEAAPTLAPLPVVVSVAGA